MFGLICTLALSATVAQINSARGEPAAKRARKKVSEKKDEPKVQITTYSQTGGTNIGVQNNYLPPDAEVIRSIELQAVLESASAPGQTGMSVGLANFCALFDAKKTRFRFGTDYKFEDRESNDRHQLVLIYKPELSVVQFGIAVQALQAPVLR